MTAQIHDEDEPGVPPIPCLLVFGFEEMLDCWAKRARWAAGPTDRTAAEESLAALYRRAGRVLPEQVYWFDEPGSFLEQERRWKESRALGDPVAELTALQALARCHVVDGRPGTLTALPPRTPDHVPDGWSPIYLGADELALFLTLLQAAGAWSAFARALLICERPATKPDLNGLHSTDGPALQFNGGDPVYAWHGIRVPPHVILQPETITPDEIEREDNVEVRRVMLHRYGLERFLRDGRGTLIDESPYGRLWALEHDSEPVPPRPLSVAEADRIALERAARERQMLPRLLEVTNATPEPDGSRKTYLLRVPPNVSTAQEAVAWTFDIDPPHYRPTDES